MNLKQIYMKIQRFFIIMVIAFTLISGSSNCQTVIKLTRNVPDFTEVSFGVPGEMYIKIGPEFKLELEGTKNTLNELLTDVSGSRLTIKKENRTMNFNEKVKVYITMPKIEGLSVSGSGKIMVEEPVNSKSLNLGVSGSGEIILSEIESEELSCSISGSGNINIEGNGQLTEGEVAISGSGNYTGTNLIFKNLRVRVSGSGNCECNVSESLEASVSGSGSVFYHGNPKIDARVSGSGHVRSK
jgi:hypothetical protein